MIRFLMDSYILLLVLSLIMAPIPALDQVAAGCWVFAVFLAGVRGETQGVSPQKIAWSGVLVQSVGIVLGIYGLWSMHHSLPAAELMGGLLEIWIHPFVPILDSLLPAEHGDWSVVYFIGCFIPCVVAWIPLAGAVFSRTRAKLVKSRRLVQ